MCVAQGLRHAVQGTPGAEILLKVCGEKFAGGNKSGQQNILALVQKTDEGKILYP